jgi:integrase
MIATKTRRGRPPKFVRHPDDNREIYGLSAQPIRKNGDVSGYRYYATYSEPRVWFGTDFHEALQRFQDWQARQNVDYVKGFVRVEVDVADHHSDWVQPERLRNILDEREFYSYDLPRRAIMRMLADVVRQTDPDELARETGIREFRDFWRNRPAQTVTLEELAAPYLDDKKDKINPKEHANSITWWTEFCEITGAANVADLDRAAFLKYRKRIETDQKTKKRVNSYRRSRFGKVKSIINYAVDESALNLSDEDRSILGNRSVLKMPPKPKPKPLKISPDELSAILKVADDWDTALILTALNAAYLNCDCARLRWDMIDWDEKTIRFDRAKSEELAEEEVPRLTVLWNRTIKALRKIQHDGEYVFEIDGRQPHIDTLYDHFIDCVEASGVAAQRKKARKRSLAFIHLRKSAITAASNDPNVPDRHVDLLAGHSKGIKEHYVVPENVVGASRAVEAVYFAKKSRSRKK